MVLQARAAAAASALRNQRHRHHRHYQEAQCYHREDISDAGLTIAKDRASLTPENAADLIFLKDAWPTMEAVEKAERERRVAKRRLDETQAMHVEQSTSLYCCQLVSYLLIVNCYLLYELVRRS